MRRLHYSLALLGIAVTSIAAVRFGGWAVITLEDLPDHAVAGQPLSLTYTVRQHGFTKLNDLHGAVDAKLIGGRDEVHVSVQRKAKDGQYLGVVTFPKAGEWLVTIRSGFGGSDVTLLPLAVQTSSASPVRAISEADRGKQLFVAKGCVTCHVHDQVPGSGRVAVGPELTKVRFPVEYLAKFLHDPSIKPSVNGKSMPKLDLAAREVAALSAFINADRQVSAK